MEHLTTTTPNATLPVSVADLKKHIRITHADDDAYLDDMAWQAYDFIEAEADITIGATTYTLVSDAFP